MKAAILVALLATSTARADGTWTTRDTAIEVAAVSILAVDYLQTSQALRSPGFQEANPILGRRPSLLGLSAYNLGIAAAHAGIAYVLPRPWREIWQASFIGIETGVVVHNFTVGARIPFP